MINIRRSRSIGFAYLKFSVSRILFQSLPYSNEGKLTKKRENQILRIQEQLKLHSNGGFKSTYAFIANQLNMEGDTTTSKLVENLISINKNNNKKKIQSMPSEIDEIYKEKEFEKLERKIGYIFQNRALLLQAFTNGSHQLAKINGTYQRLEFLGDAILEYLIVRYLYNQCTNFTRAEIAHYHRIFTSNETFSPVSKKHDLQKYFLHNSKLHGQKCFADIFESLVAAIYIDSGMNLDVVWDIVYKMFKKLKFFKKLDLKI